LQQSESRSEELELSCRKEAARSYTSIASFVELIMAALRSRCGHYIFVLFLPFFLAWSQRSENGCLPYFHTYLALVQI